MNRERIYAVGMALAVFAMIVMGSQLALIVSDLYLLANQ